MSSESVTKQLKGKFTYQSGKIRKHKGSQEVPVKKREQSVFWQTHTTISASKWSMLSSIGCAKLQKRSLQRD